MHTHPTTADLSVYVRTCEQYLTRCQQLLREAQTIEARQQAQLWVDNAERQLARWQAAQATAARR